MWKDGTIQFIKDNILSNIYAFHAQKKLKRKLAGLQKEGISLVIPNDKGLDLDAFTKEIEAYLDKENDRKKSIEDKAKSCLFIVTLAITVMFGGLNFIKDGKVTFKAPLLLLIILGVVYLVLSGITAVQALNVREYYTLYPDDWTELDQNQRTVVGLRRLDKIKLLYAVMKANELVLNLRTNFVHATFIGIRNGIILLALAFIVAVANIGNQVRYAEEVKREPSSESLPINSPAQNQNGLHPNKVTPTPDNTAPANVQSAPEAPKEQINPTGEKQPVDNRPANTSKRANINKEKGVVA